MPETDPCEICGVAAETLPNGDYDGVHQRCPRCGDFRLSGTGCAVIRQLPREAKVKLSGWVRDQNILREVPELTSDQIKRIAAAPIPGIIERADRLLTLAVRRQTSLGRWLGIYDPAFEVVTYSKDMDEVIYLAKFLQDQGFMSVNVRNIMVTPRGHVRYEELHAHQAASAQGFVAMWFDESMRDAYVNGFEAGIRAAGYDPVRVDRVEHVGRIDDEIIAQIRRSRFIVADFTGHRGGVYFEAGFALGLNSPVFWTCRRDAIEELHFDIRQFNCIDWIEPSDLAKRLKNRIGAVIGTGPRATSPVVV